MKHPPGFHVVVIGTDYMAEEYRFRNGYPREDRARYVTVVKTVEDLNIIMELRPAAQVVFLNCWEALDEGRAIYNRCLAQGWAQPWRIR